MIQKPNNADKGRKLMHQHIIRNSDQGNLPEFTFSKASKVNSLDLYIICRRPIFMAWVFMILQIKYVIFILGLNLKERGV